MHGVLGGIIHDGLLIWACIAACGFGYLGGQNGFDDESGWAAITVGFMIAAPPVAIIWSAAGEGEGIVVATFAVLFGVSGAIVGRRRENAREARKAWRGQILLEMRRLWEADHGEGEGEPPWWGELWQELMQR